MLMDQEFKETLRGAKVLQYSEVVRDGQTYPALLIRTRDGNTYFVVPEYLEGSRFVPATFDLSYVDEEIVATPTLVTHRKAPFAG